MPIKATPQQYADRWTTGLSGSTQKITDGVNSITVSPTTQAAAAQAKMLQNLTAAVNSGKWANNLKKVTLADWKTAMLDKGVPRISTGATAANGKMAAFAQQLLPYEATLQQTVRAMPNLTLTDAKARAVAWIDGMSKFSKK